MARSSLYIEESMKFQENVDRQDRSVRRFHHQELQMKANELEVLFAAHKLRINAAKLSHEIYGRGEFYERYVNRRETKLRREWELNGEEKEANLNDLELKFNQMVADFQAKLYGAIDSRRESLMSVRKQMKKHGSFNAHSINHRTKTKEDEGVHVSLDNRFKGHGRMLERSLSLSSRTSEPASETLRQQPNYPISRKENVNLPPRGATFSKSKSTSQVSPIVREDRSLRRNSGLVSASIPMTPRKFGDKNMLLYGKLSKQQDLVPSPYLENKKVELSSSRNVKELKYRFDGCLDRRKSWSGQAQVFQSRIPAPSPNFKLREDRRLSTDSLKGKQSFFSIPSFRNKTIDLKSNSKGW